MRVFVLRFKCELGWYSVGIVFQVDSLCLLSLGWCFLFGVYMFGICYFDLLGLGLVFAKFMPFVWIVGILVVG